MALSKRNRRGIWMLIVLCVSLACIPRVLASLNPATIYISNETLEVATEKVENNQEIARQKKAKKKPSKYKVPPQKFDPNTYDLSDWMYLGLSEKQANVVLKFTKRGINSNEELQKIYVIPQEVFALIEDSTFYPEHEFHDQEDLSLVIPKTVDINTASIEELKSLPGIGDFYAKKIIEQRNIMGGFVRKDQLKELWKFGEERYEGLKEQIVLSSDIRQIDINSADLETLSQHPYISYKVANSIVKMRAAHGKYTSVEEIKKSVLIDHELYSKIQPYLTIE